MGIRDELHDIKVVGGLRNYLHTLWHVKRGNWEWRRIHGDRAKARAARHDKRLMKTSTYDALAESVEEHLLTEQVVHEDLLRDTEAVEKRRWIERASWLVLCVVTAGFGYLAGDWAAPMDDPKPWDCIVHVKASTPDDVNVMRCVGGSRP